MWWCKPRTHAARDIFSRLVEFGYFAREGSVSGSAGSCSVLIICSWSWVIGANMQCKFSVALQLEVAHHFVERCAGERAGRFEPPATFGATKTLKTLLLNPYQFSAHICQCRCAQRRLTRLPSTRLQPGGEAFSFHSRVAPDCTRNPSSIWAWLKVRQGMEFTCANLDGLSGILHTRNIIVRAPAVVGCDPGF